MKHYFKATDLATAEAALTRLRKDPTKHNSKIFHDAMLELLVDGDYGQACTALKTNADELHQLECEVDPVYQQHSNIMAMEDPSLEDSAS